jgi:hypothetical protein
MATTADQASNLTQIHQAILEAAARAQRMMLVDGSGVPVIIGSSTLDFGVSSAASRVAAQIGNASGANAVGNPVWTNLTSGGASYDARQIRALTSADVVSSAQSGSWTVGITGTVPLPTGASTSALQTSGNASLTSIDSKIPALGQALAGASTPVVLTAAQITTLTPQTNGLTDAQLRATAVPVSVSGVATAALQGTGNTSLSSIDTKLTSQATATKQDAQTALLTTIDTSVSAINGATGSIDSKLVQLALGAGSVATSQRVFATLGNVSGIADFNAGTTGAQTVRVTANITRNGTELSYGAGASDANSQRMQLANESLPGRGATAVQITSATLLPYILDTSSTAITSAFSLVVASTPADINRIEVFNGSGTPVYLATGAAASEVVQYIIPPGGSSSQISLRIPSGSRLSIRAFTGTINSGYFIMNFGG